MKLATLAGINASSEAPQGHRGCSQGRCRLHGVGLDVGGVEGNDIDPVESSAQRWLQMNETCANCQSRSLALRFMKSGLTFDMASSGGSVRTLPCWQYWNHIRARNRLHADQFCVYALMQPLVIRLFYTFVCCTACIAASLLACTSRDSSKRLLTAHSY